MGHVLDKVDALVAELKLLEPVSAESKQKLDKKFRLEFNYNSNHLEGNTLTYGETELLLIFDDTKGNHSLREYEEMKAHDVAYHLVEEWARDDERTLSEQYIKNLNEIILVRPYWKDAQTPDGQASRRQIKVGDYKEYPNSVRLANGEIFNYASPTETPIKMQELIDWYRSEENAIHPVTLAAMLHYKFVCIHPFDDGNGRISRLLMNYVFLRNGLPPIVIKSADKRNYLNALHLADVGDYSAFITYIGEQLVWSLEMSIKAAKGESIEEAGDLDKMISLLDKDLQTIDSDNEVKTRLSAEYIDEVFHSWLSNLIYKAIPKIQKFNKFFTGTNHHVDIVSIGAHVYFVNEAAVDILKSLQIQLEHGKDRLQSHDVIFGFSTFYGTLIKGGLNTFGCNYGFEVRFDTIKYAVFVDEFTEGNQRKQVMLFERLLHKSITLSEMDEITDRLAKAIYNHIDFFTKKNGLR